MRLADLRTRNARPIRAHEWSHAKSVTFIVTLAATRNVTLAARAAGMSRKAAYALKVRDSLFAQTWEQALGARRKGNEVDEVNDPQLSFSRGNKCRARRTCATRLSRYPQGTGR